MFTKAQYLAVAGVIADLMPNVEVTPEQVRDAFSDLFAKTDPAFDRKGFDRACDLLAAIEPRKVTVNTLPAALGPRYSASNPLPPPVGDGPFEVETVGHMEGSRVVITGKAFRLLRVGQAFRHAAASPMVWVKTGSRTFRQRVDGYAHGPTHTVSNMAMLVVLEP